MPRARRRAAVTRARGFTDDVAVLGRGRHPQRSGLSLPGRRGGDRRRRHDDQPARHGRLLHAGRDRGVLHGDHRARAERVQGDLQHPLPRRPRARGRQQPGRDPRRRAPGRVHDQRHRRAGRQRLARGDRDGVARAPRSRAVHDRHRHPRDLPEQPAADEADRRRRAGQQGDRRAQRVRARGRHPPGRHAQGPPHLRDHERRGRRRPEVDAGARQALGPARRPEALRGSRPRLRSGARSRLSRDDRARRSQEARLTTTHGQDAVAAAPGARAAAPIMRLEHRPARRRRRPRGRRPRPSTSSTRSAELYGRKFTTTEHAIGAAAICAPGSPLDSDACQASDAGAARRGRRSGLRHAAAGREDRDRPAGLARALGASTPTCAPPRRLRAGPRRLARQARACRRRRPGHRPRAARRALLRRAARRRRRGRLNGGQHDALQRRARSSASPASPSRRRATAADSSPRSTRRTSSRRRSSGARRSSPRSRWSIPTSRSSTSTSTRSR